MFVEKIRKISITILVMIPCQLVAQENQDFKKLAEYYAGVFKQEKKEEGAKYIKVGTGRKEEKNLKLISKGKKIADEFNEVKISMLEIIGTKVQASAALRMYYGSALDDGDDDYKKLDKKYGYVHKITNNNRETLKNYVDSVRVEKSQEKGVCVAAIDFVKEINENAISWDEIQLKDSVIRMKYGLHIKNKTNFYVEDTLLEDVKGVKGINEFSVVKKKQKALESLNSVLDNSNLEHYPKLKQVEDIVICSDETVIAQLAMFRFTLLHKDLLLKIDNEKIKSYKVSNAFEFINNKPMVKNPLHQERWESVQDDIKDAMKDYANYRYIEYLQNNR